MTKGMDQCCNLERELPLFSSYQGRGLEDSFLAFKSSSNGDFCYSYGKKIDRQTTHYSRCNQVGGGLAKTAGSQKKKLL